MRSHRSGPGNTPLVSIVTPTFNRADYLQWTINSIRNQTYRHFEHIVADGESTDGTLALLRSQQTSYRLRWQSEPDAGMYEAINKGLELAAGDILAYLNSDDLYFPWTIEAVVNAFAHHPDVDFVYGDALAVDDDTGRVSTYWMLPFDLDYVRRCGFLAQPTVFWRRRAWEALGPFDESLRYVADCEFWMRAGTNHRFHKIDEFLAIERLHRSTLREAVGAPLWKELEAVRERFVTSSGPDHERRLQAHDIRRRAYERRYKARLLSQAFVPAPLRRGAWHRLLNSRVVHVERARYALRALVVGQYVPGIRAWSARDILRGDRSLLEPAVAADVREP